jgi:hypothetical protein
MDMDMNEETRVLKINKLPACVSGQVFKGEDWQYSNTASEVFSAGLDVPNN